MTTELTTTRRLAVQKSWELVDSNLKENGCQFFIRFFRENPPYKDYFRQFHGIDIEQLASSQKLRAHAMVVMHSLSAVIGSLDEVECAAIIVRKIVRDHYPRGIRIIHYQNLMKTLAGFLSDKLGDGFEGDTKAGWLQVVQLLLSIIEEELNVLDQLPTQY